MELLDFESRANFEFLKFGSLLPEERKEVFYANCEKILEYAHATVKDLCLLGYRLKELKGFATWQYVIDPETGKEYRYDNFAEFCGYAFGFSKTKVSNLLAIAEFVKLNGPNVDFIDEKYAGYNTSQLIELASVYVCNRDWFSPKQTISEMRLIKKQLSGDWHSNWTPEEALAEAKRRAGVEAVQKCCAQVKAILSESEQEPEAKFPAGAMEEPGGESVEAMAEGGESDVGIDEECSKAEVSDVGQMEDDEDYEDDEGGEDGMDPAFWLRYNLTTRAGRRAFLQDYRTWHKDWGRPLSEQGYSCFLKNKSELYAVEESIGTGRIDDRKQETGVRYYFRFSTYEDWFRVTKEQLEEYMASHIDELR